MACIDRVRTTGELRAIDTMKTVACRIDVSTANQMVVLYRTGLTQAAIAEALIPQEVKKSQKVATGAVQIVLRENMPDDELEAIRHERKVISGRALGALSADGVHGFLSLKENERRKLAVLGRAALAEKIDSGELDKDIFVEAGRKGGKKASKVNRRNKTGIFGMTLEQRQKIGSRNGTKMKADGKGIFSPQERTPEKMKVMADRMLAKTGKLRVSGPEKVRLMELVAASESGIPDYIMIQRVLEDEFGGRRTVVALRNIVYRERKSKLL